MDGTVGIAMLLVYLTLWAWGAIAEWEAERRERSAPRPEEEAE